MPSAIAATALLSVLPIAAAAAPFPAAPEGWEAFKISDKKKPTYYRLTEEAGRPVLHAIAAGSASGLTRHAHFNVAERPLVAWRWKVSRLVASADNSKARAEDAPARLIFAFDGDKSKLGRIDQATLYVSQKLYGREMPYATLMYIWANRAPVGAVIENPHTKRVQMVVASSGPAGVGSWQSVSRNLLEDFRRAFKEEPGRLLTYGVMTDTDNTGEMVEAWYGEIEFQAASAALRPRATSTPASRSSPATK
jgi:hypothetical protein